MPRSCAAGLAVRTRTAARPGGRREPRERNAAVKPVSRILSAVASPLRARLRRDDHSSSPGIAAGIKQPTRRLRTGRPQPPPYLVLLRAGFCLPPTLPPARCALTAPFHPYPPPPFWLRWASSVRGLPLRSTRRVRRRAVCFLCHFPSGCPARALAGALPCGV